MQNPLGSHSVISPKSVRNSPEESVFVEPRRTLSVCTLDEFLVTLKTRHDSLILLVLCQIFISMTQYEMQTASFQENSYFREYN